jgi:hypothetical protein
MHVSARIGSLPLKEPFFIAREPTPLNAPAHLRRRDLLGGLIHEYEAA